METPGFVAETLTEDGEKMRQSGGVMKENESESRVVSCRVVSCRVVSITLMRRVSSFLLCAASAVFQIATAPNASAGPILGSAASFAVLGASEVTNTGATTLNGDLGVYPAPSTSITGTATITFKGASTNQGNDADSQGAQTDLTTAYDVLKALPDTMDLTGHDLGTSGTSPIGTLDAGIYKFDSTAQLNGTLTLDAQGNPNALFIFDIGTALTTASASAVDVINGGANVGVYWLMGVTGGSGTGSATLGTTTAFEGNILALDSITLTTNATILCGRALAQNAAVTMDTNTISNNCSTFNNGGSANDFGSSGFSGGGTITTGPNGPVFVPAASVPEPGTVVLLGAGIVGLVAGRLRSARRRQRDLRSKS